MSKLKIAFVSYEYSPDIGQGGIATYIGQAAKAMLELGHHVEIFSGSPNRECTEFFNDVLTHRVLSNNPNEFRENVLLKFIERHTQIQFDLFECAEINADGARIKQMFPELPLIVKLHAPTYLLVKLLNYYTPLTIKLRFFLGNLRRGVWRLWGKPDLRKDTDYLFTLKANKIISPSNSLKLILTNDWKLPFKKITTIPNPYRPNNDTLSIPLKRNNRNSKVNILFIGKLNIQKGILLLAQVIPIIQSKYDHVYFTLVGGDGPSYGGFKTMRQYLEYKFKGLKGINFEGAVDLDKIPEYLNKSDVVVIPSLWENFPYVCLEAMSGGRAIIGSQNGGMSEMLCNGAGILIDPKNKQQLLNALCFLIENPNSRFLYGRKARETVLRDYNLMKVGKQMENVYFDALRAS